jgi:hypothetical protein
MDEDKLKELNAITGGSHGINDWSQLQRVAKGKVVKLGCHHVRFFSDLPKLCRSWLHMQCTLYTVI